MAQLQKREQREYQTTLPVTEFIGRNTFGEHSALLPGEFREIIDYEVYPRYLKTRRGSQYLKPDSGALKYPIGSSNVIWNGLVWDVGDIEYLITQVGNTFYSQNITTPGNPVRINEIDGSSFILTWSYAGAADMFLQGDRIYVFHESGNYIIEYNNVSGIFEIRGMGMTKPVIEDLLDTGEPGQISGKYTYGIEKVYQKNDADILASSPNRIITALHATRAKEIATTDTLLDTKVDIEIQAAELDNDTLWTHIRLWRSKNQNMDLTEEDVPIDAEGEDGELYEVALITKAELENVGLAAIATSTDYILPSGNKNVEAGTVSGTYTVRDNCLDRELIDLITIDDIELIPIDKCEVGAYHQGRIYVSGIQSTSFGDDKKVLDKDKYKVYYGSNLADKYREQYKSTNKVLGIQNDGQKTKKIISFEKDLIVLKEAKTIRLPNGFIDLEAEEVDHRIGISHRRLAQYIPGVGICAITNDYGDFKIWGYDNIWRGTFNNMNISIMNRTATQALQNSPDHVSFIYINGKLMISDGEGNFQILNVETGRGWSEYQYPMNDSADLAVVYSNGRKALVCTYNQYLVEIDAEDLDVDVNTAEDNESEPILPEYTTWMFQSNYGADVIEHEWLSIMAKPTKSITVTPHVNSVPWPDITTDIDANVVVDPGVGNSNLLDKEYRLYIEPQSMGNFEWSRMIGNFLHYKVLTTAPAIIKVHKLFCIVDEDGIAYGEFDPYQTFADGQTEPPWVSDVIEETGVATTQIVESGSQSDVIQET